MNRDFKGIWIPREIWLSKDLTMQEKIFLVEIDSLDNEDGCFASNAYFAEFFDLSKDRVSVVINSLVNKGYITSTIDNYGSDNQKRILRVNKAPDKTPGGIRGNTEGVSVETRRGIRGNADLNNISNNIENKETNPKGLTHSVIPLFTQDKNPLDDYNHLAVSRFKKKINNNVWLVDSFTDTDWLIGFISEYNRKFPTYNLPPMGAQFNGLVHPFSKLFVSIPKKYRREVFVGFIELLDKETTIQQLVSDYNFSKTKSKIEVIYEAIRLIATSNVSGESVIYETF